MVDSDKLLIWSAFVFTSLIVISCSDQSGSLDESENTVPIDTTHTTSMPLQTTSSPVDTTTSGYVLRQNYHSSDKKIGVETSKISDFSPTSFLMMSLLILLSVSFVYLLLKLGSFRVNQRRHIEQEDDPAHLDDQNINVDPSRQLALHIRNTKDEIHTISQKMTDLTTTFMTLQNKIDQKDEEIIRLKQGYDATIFRKFISRFARVDQMIHEVRQKGSADGVELSQISLLMEDAFAECGIESFSPALGSDFRTASGVADNPDTVETTDAGQDFMIASIIEPGYRYASSENQEVVIPAKVEIYIKDRKTKEK